MQRSKNTRLKNIAALSGALVVMLLLLLTSCIPSPLPGTLLTPGAARKPSHADSPSNGPGNTRVRNDPLPAPSRRLQPGQRIKFERISLEQGLSQSSVLCMLQDSQGFMWFGTADGLNRYDGYRFKEYKHEPENSSSLSDNTIWAIYEDREGTLWIGTDNGLNQFDRENERFTRYHYDPENPHSLSHNGILSIQEDLNGMLWIGTWGGLNELDRESGRFTHYRHDPRDPTSLSHNTVETLQVDQQGILWVGTWDGLDRFEAETGQFLHYQTDPDDPQTLSHDVVQTIYEDQSGVLWIGTGGGGINRYNRETDTFTRYLIDPRDIEGFTYNDVKAIHEDYTGALWIGTDGGGLNKFDRQTEQFISYQTDPNNSNSLSSNYVTAIYEDRTGVLWIGTWGGGINKYDHATERFNHYQADPNNVNSLSHNGVLAIYEDPDSILWIGTDGGGLNRFEREDGLSYGTFTHYKNDPDNPKSLSNNYVVSIFEDQAGILWVGTEGGGLDRFNRTTEQFVHHRAIPNSQMRGQAFSVYEDQAGTLWIGMHGGGLNKLLLSDAEGVNREQVLNSLSHNMVKTIIQDHAGALWIGTHGGGLNKFVLSPKLTQEVQVPPNTEQASLLSDGTFTHYKHADSNPSSLSNNVIWSIYEDSAGVLWIGTGNGLNKLIYPANTRDMVNVYAEGYDTRAEFIHYQHDPNNPRSISHNVILSIYEDHNGTLWVGTGEGLNKFDRATETFTYYKEKDGLPNNVVYGILEDEQGYLWLSTNKGLSKFDTKTEKFRNYGVSDGLQGYEFSRACFKSPSGEMFFGGINGFNAFYPSEVRDNPYVPPIVLTLLTQSGDIPTHKAVESLSEITLYWPNNLFEFEFAALSYTQPEKNQYAYKLEGFEDSWNYVGTRRFGRYTNLPGGTYTLRIKGSNNDGVWNEVGTQLTITVIPPVWETWWFRTSAVLILVLGLLSGYRFRIKNIAARNLELKSQVQERTQEIEQRRQELEALYRADEELYHHLRLDQVLKALVDIAVDILKADKSYLVVWNPQHTQLVVQVARGFNSPMMAQMNFKPDESLIGQVATTGEIAVVMDTATNDAVNQDIIEPEAIRSLMHVPIMVDGEVFGIFSADYVHPHAFGEDEQRLFVSLTQRAALAIENAQLYEQAQELAVVEERNRLARDLHDAVTQTLFSASLISETLPTLWESDKEEGNQLLKELRQLTRGALAEMRTLLLELRPATLVEANLGDLLRQLAEAATGRTGVPVQLNVQGQCQLAPDVHVALYRIAQEALNNVVKYAYASAINVGLYCTHQTVEGDDVYCVKLHINDNGRGFDPDKVSPDRLGLHIIQERAEAVGARLEIKTRLGYGTQIHVTYPKTPL